MRTVPKFALTLLLPCLCRAAPPQSPTADSGTKVASDGASMLSRATTLIEAGKNDQAIQLLTPMADRRPESAGVERALGKAYYQERKLDQATAHLEAALKQDPGDLESTQLLGLAYSQLGRAGQAIPLLEKVQAALPHPDPTSFYVLGVDDLSARRFGEARANFAKMFSVGPDSAQAHLVLGQMMMHQNLEDEAEPELKQALATDPKLPMAHFLLGEVALYRGRTEEALAEFKAELALDPVSWVAYWRMGDAYSRLGRWDEAERALKQSLWLDQTFTGPYVLLGKVELKKGDAGLAADYLERALAMDPANFSAHYLLGTAYQQMGRAADAAREFETSRKLHPEGVP